jgi:hypothetical protein
VHELRRIRPLPVHDHQQKVVEGWPTNRTQSGRRQCLSSTAVRSKVQEPVARGSDRGLRYHCRTSATLRRENDVRPRTTRCATAPVAMLDMIKGFWVSRALYVAAKLGIPDLLRDEPKSSDDLARATGTHAPSLYRVLRALDSVGVFAEDDRGRFALTPLGATLRTDVSGSLRYFAIEELGENHYPAWERVLHSVETGAIAFNHVYGVSKWQYMAEHADEARIFDAAMSSFSSVVAAAVVAAYDFSSSATVVDIGRGDGTLLGQFSKGTRHCAAWSRISPTLLKERSAGWRRRAWQTAARLPRAVSLSRLLWATLMC